MSLKTSTAQLALWIAVALAPAAVLAQAVPSASAPKTLGALDDHLHNASAPASAASAAPALPGALSPSVPLAAPAAPAVAPTMAAASAPSPLATVHPTTPEASLNEAANIQGQIALLTQRAKLQELQNKQQTDQFKFQADVAKANDEVRQHSEPKSGGSKSGGSLGSMMSDEPFVNSVYMMGGTSYAEVYVGLNKVIANEGTRLSNGAKVTKITPTGIYLGRTFLPVKGSAFGGGSSGTEMAPLQSGAATSTPMFGIPSPPPPGR